MEDTLDKDIASIFERLIRLEAGLEVQGKTVTLNDIILKRVIWRFHQILQDVSAALTERNIEGPFDG